MSRFKLDLNDVRVDGRAVENELERAIDEAMSRRVTYLEVVFGEDKGEIKKRVLRFLAQPKLQGLYHRVEKDEKIFGRVFVHFRLRSNRKNIGLLGFEKGNKIV